MTKNGSTEAFVHHPTAAAGDTSEGLTIGSFRELPVEEMIRWIGRHGEPQDVREGVDTDSLLKRFPHLARVQIRPLSLAGSTGELQARAYRDPSHGQAERGLIWAHGGAFLGGNLDMPEANWVALELASRGLPVLSIDYTKCVNGVHYPAPSDDVLLWWSAAREHAPDWLGTESDRLVLGGASAGAALVASAIRRAIDNSSGVPAGLVLVYPALHPDPSAPASRGPFDPQTHGLSLNYAGSHEALLDPHAFAGLGDGRGYPPSLIVGCELDDLLPSAEAFFETLRASGVDARLRIEENSHHGHIDEPGTKNASATLDAVFEWIANLRS